jgi:hypothetical protein
MTALTHTNTKPEMGWLDHKKLYRKWFVVGLFGNLPLLLPVRVKKEANSGDGEFRYG